MQKNINPKIRKYNWKETSKPVQVIEGLTPDIAIQKHYFTNYPLGMPNATYVPNSVTVIFHKQYQTSTGYQVTIHHLGDPFGGKISLYGCIS